MSTKKQLAVLLAGLAVCSAPALYADRTEGDYTFAFGENLKVWDISGSYNEAVGGLTLDYNISSEPSGKFTGQGTATLEDYDTYLNLGFTVNGTMSSAGTVTRVNLTMKMSGSGQVQGYDCTMKATATEKLEVDSASQQLIGTFSGRVSVTVPAMHKSASAPIPRTDVQTSLPAGMTGDWNLAFTVSTNLNKYAGSGTVQVVNGATLPLTLTGSYKPKSDLSKVSLKGQGLFRSVNLSLALTCTNDVVSVKTLSGKVLGQKLKLPASK